jgi:hypothetical protein
MSQAISVRPQGYCASVDEKSLRERILQSYFEEHRSQSDVADMLGITQWKVQDRIRRCGRVARPRWWNNQRRYSLNETVADELTPQLAWILGWMVSDGYVREHVFGWRLAERDIDVLEQFRTFFGYSGPIYRYRCFLARTQRTYPMVHLKIHSPRLVGAWGHFGVVPNKTTRERYPERLLSADEETTRCFIRGVFEGDGSILLDGKTSLLFQIVGCRELLIEIQRQLVRYVGVDVTKLTHNIKGQNHYALRYRGRYQALRIFDWLYLDSKWHLKRKHDRYLEIRELLGRST